MKKATKKEEIAILEEALDVALIDPDFKIQHILPSLEYKHKLLCKRCAKFIKGKENIAYWQWNEFLVTLQLGWRRYFYACNHKDSIFCRIYFHEKKVTKGCECCLYWRGIATGFLLAIILASLFNLGKFLL